MSDPALKVEERPTGDSGATEETLPATTKGGTPLTVGQRGFNLTTLDEAWRFATMLAKSDLAPKDYRGKPTNALVAIQFGLELGLPPMQALQNIAVVNGRPSIWGPLGMALVEASGLLQDKEGVFVGTFDKDDYTYRFMTQRRGRKPYWTEFSIADAKRAELWGKNTWKNYPKRMLMWRAIWQNLNDNFPDVLKGIHGAEIAQDLDAIDVTATPSDPAQTEALTERIRAAQEKIQGSAPAAPVEKPAAPSEQRVRHIAACNALLEEIDALKPGETKQALYTLCGEGSFDDLDDAQLVDCQPYLVALRDKLKATVAAALSPTAETPPPKPSTSTGATAQRRLV